MSVFSRKRVNGNGPPAIVKGVLRADDAIATIDAGKAACSTFVHAYLYFSQLRTALLTPRARCVRSVRMVCRWCGGLPG